MKAQHRTLLALALAGGLIYSQRGRAAITPAPAGARGEPMLYTVRPGDSLSIIARDELGNLERWRELATLNNITAPYVIYPGAQILMPIDYGA